MRTCQVFSAVLAFQAITVPQSSHAAEHGLSGALVLGAAQGLILGIVLVLYVFAWRPFKERVLEPRKRAKLAAQLPGLVIKAADGDAVGLGALLAEGQSPNQAGPTGQTALMLAARNGNAEVVRLLLEHGADPALKTKTGSTAEDIARTYKHEECVSLLANTSVGSRPL